MKKEYLILLVFLAIIAFSGMLIYMYHSSKPVPQTARQSEMQMPPDSAMQPGPDTLMLKKQIADLESHLKHDSSDYQSIVGVANAYYDMDKAQEAIEYYERALKINPNDPGVLVDIGAMYRQQKNPDKAIELFNELNTFLGMVNA